MLKSQLRHAYCVLIIWLRFVQVLSLKDVSGSHPVHVDHIVFVERLGSKAVSIDNSALAAHSLSDHVGASTRFRKYGSAFHSEKVSVLVTTLALWVVVAVACLAALWIGASDDEESPRSTHRQQLRGEKAQAMLRKSSVMSDYNVMDTSPQVGVGSYAERYQQSTGRDREALELLLKCSVISQERSYSDSVSLEHLEECIHVAKVMLLQKPLDVWVELGPERGQKSFKEFTVAVMISDREEAWEEARLNEGSEVTDPPETHVPQNRPPDSPQNNDGSMFSPGSIQDSYVPVVSLGSSVSFGVEEIGPSSVSFGVERQSGDSGPPKALEAPSADLLVPAYNMPPTIPPVTPQTTAAEHKSPVPVLSCYTRVDKAPVIDYHLMDAEWTQLQNTNPLPEKFPACRFNTNPLPEKFPACRFSKAEDAAPPSSNEAIQSNPSAPSLGGEGGGFLSILSRPSGPPPASQETHYLMTSSSSGLVTQASQGRIHRLIPSPEGLPLTSPEDTPTYPTLPPKEKLFSFEPHEVSLQAGLVTQASQGRIHRLIPSPEGLPLTSPEDTPTYPTLPPREKLFSFKSQEVMAPPPEPSIPEEERALRSPRGSMSLPLSRVLHTPPGSMSLPVARRGSLPEGTVRRLTSASDLTPLAGHRRAG